MLDKKVIRKSLIIILIILLILIAITFIRRTFSRYESDSESIAPVDMALWIVNEGFTTENLNIGEITPIPVEKNELFDTHILGIFEGTKTMGSLIQDDTVVGYEDYIKAINFTIQNYNEDGDGDVGLVSSVPLRYEIKLTATTNMPLEYRLYQYDNSNSIINSTPCVVSDNIITDSDGTCYREIRALPNDSNGNDFYLDDEGIGGVNTEKDKFLLLAWMPDQNNDRLTSNDENHMFADLMEYIKLEIKAEQIMSGDED